MYIDGVINQWMLTCVLSPWLKYREQNCSLDNLTFWLSNFGISVVSGNCDITSFLWHVSFSELSLLQHISRFWWKICLSNQLLSFLLIFLRMKMFMKKYKPSEFITIWKGQRGSWRKCLRTQHTTKISLVQHPMDSFKRNSNGQIMSGP